MWAAFNLRRLYFHSCLRKLQKTVYLIVNHIILVQHIISIRACARLPCAKSRVERCDLATQLHAIYASMAAPELAQLVLAGMGLPRWPAGWHDMLQYHFFFEDMFVQVLKQISGLLHGAAIQLTSIGDGWEHNFLDGLSSTLIRPPISFEHIWT